MSSLSSPVGSQQQQQPFVAPDFKPSPDTLLDTAAPWLLPSPETTKGRKLRKSSKHHSKRHRKEKKHHVKRQLGAYLLQLIGLVCLLVGAFKAFEPLTGIGFTLVIVGYQGSIGDGDLRDILRSEKKRQKKSKSKRRKGEEGGERVTDLLKEEE